MEKKLIVLTGAGTGGHIFTNIYLYVFLKNYSSAFNFIYISGASALEEKILSSYSINSEFIKTAKLGNHISLQSIIDFFRMIYNFFKVFSILKKNRPDIIFSSGGYVAFSVVLIGFFLKIPIFIHEQTTVMGLTNRISSFFAKKIYLGFPIEKNLSKNLQKKASFIGQTLNDVFWNLNKKSDPSLKDFFQISKKLIYITGGSQGAHNINLIFYGLLPILLKKSYKIVYQYGIQDVHKKDYLSLKEAINLLSEEEKNSCVFFDFIDSTKLYEIYEKTDLIIGRSGALSLSEAVYFSVPAIWIPYPHARGNEQYYNALYMKNIGIAEIIEQKNLSLSRLEEEIDFLFESKKITWMKKNFKSFHKENLKNHAVNTILNDFHKILKN